MSIQQAVGTSADYAEAPELRRLSKNANLLDAIKGGWMNSECPG
jgi:hypothetical protein